jgi:hypothetical protein
MEFQGSNPAAVARRRAFADLVDACGGDTEMADDLVAALADDPPSLDDLRRLVAHAREVAADIEEERRKRVR